ncbi:MAG: DMT family transporter [Acidobacteriota bacterium]
MSRLDLLLLLMVVIWGSNFTVVKVALVDFPELPFNALRLVLAAALLLGALWWERRQRGESGLGGFTARDWQRLAVLGVVGHFIYQLCFLGGVARTSVGNSSLIFGCTPVTVALLASLAGHERVGLTRWVGAALSLTGIYALVGHQAAWSRTTLTGDALIFGGMLCWSLYSVLSQPLLRRHSPLAVTGWSMAIGATLYGAAAVPAAMATNWAGISLQSWALMTASSVLALAVAFIIWYTAVQRIGSTRTAVYSNVTPMVAMVVAAVWIGEPIHASQVVGAAAILGGVAVARLGPSPPAPVES